MTTGEKIAALRRKAGLSQEALADRLHISRQAVSKWEADLAVPSMDNLIELGRLFAVPVDTLLRPDEALPGSEPAGETPPGATVSPEGYRVSWRPALTRRTRGFIIAVTVLIAVSAAGCVALLLWASRLQDELRRLQSRVDALPSGGAVYVPAPAPAAENSDMIDTRIDCTLAADDPGQMVLSLRAVPREADGTARAQFCVRPDEGQAVTVDAAYESGAYTGEARAPLADSISVYLTLQQGEETRNLLVGSRTGQKEEFSFPVRLFLTDGGLTQTAAQPPRLTGRLEVQVGQNEGQTRVYPVSGRVVVYAFGKEYDSRPIDEIAARKDEWLDPALQHATLYFYEDLDWQAIDAPFDQITWGVELTDNFGRKTTHTA